MKAGDEHTISLLQRLKLYNLSAYLLRHRGAHGAQRAQRILPIQDWWFSLMAANSWHTLFLSISEITSSYLSRPSETSGTLQNFCSTQKHCSELLRNLRSFRIIFFQNQLGICEKYSSLDRIPLPKYKQSFFLVLELHPWHANCGPNIRPDQTTQPLSLQIHEHRCEIWDKLGK